jgi:hypothetical protein
MHIDFDDSVLRALHRYIRLVSGALGLSGDSSYVQADETVSAYVALERRLNSFPDRDVALLWDEDRGWSAAIETHSGEDLLVVACFGQDVVPQPAAVAEWVDDLFDRDRTTGELGDGEVPRRTSTDTGVTTRLAAYAVPVWVDNRPFYSSLTDADA